jgi:predicted RNA-binding protein YlxR (DUF448 family)
MKKVPLRKCVVTNEKLPKKELIRVVKDNTGKVFVDYSSKANGRGAYLKKSSEVIELAIKKNSLGRALETKIDPSIYEELRRLV